MSKPTDGIIALLGFDVDCYNKQEFSIDNAYIALDFQITNNFPIISFDPKNKISVIDTSGLSKKLLIQHFSVPQNLNIHLTTRTREHKYFDTFAINKEKGLLTNDQLRLFTWFSGPINTCKKLKSLKRSGAQLIVSIPGKNNKYTEKTGIFADFLIHKEKISETDLMKIPFANESCYTIKSDVPTFNPISLHFSGIFRQEPHCKVNDAYLTIRYGFYESTCTGVELDIPFPERP